MRNGPEGALYVLKQHIGVEWLDQHVDWTSDIFCRLHALPAFIGRNENDWNVYVAISQLCGDPETIMIG